MSTSNNYYDQTDITTLDKFVLAEALEFTDLNNIKGKFYYSAMTPDDSKTAPTDIKKGKYYTKSNYLELNIPTFILLQYMKLEVITIKDGDGIYRNLLSSSDTSYTIPKGTVFVGELVGGTVDANKITIVGLYLPSYK